MLVWERMGQLRGNSLRPFCGLQHLANDKVYILHISYILCMYEGAKDDAASMRKYAKEPVAAVQSLVDDGYLEVDGKQVPCCVKFCGDNLMAGDAMMLQGAGGACGCNFCKCPKTQFLETRPEVLATYGARTLQEIKELAHLVPVDCCKGCGIKVVKTQVEKFFVLCLLCIQSMYVLF